MVLNNEFDTPENVAKLWGGEDEPDQYIVLSFDPGGTTGWSVIGVHPDAMCADPEIRPIDAEYGNVLFWTAGQFTGPQDAQIDECVSLIESWTSARLVTEGFKLRQLNAELSPVEINAVLRWAVRPRYFVVQNPALAMSIGDDRLKALGFWLPGKEHARDAIRHGITFINRQKQRAVAAGRR